MAMRFINRILGRLEPPPKEIPEEGPFFHTMSVGEVASVLETDTERGLTSEKVSLLHQQYGPNRLDLNFRTPTWRLFIRHFIKLYTLIMGTLVGVSVYLEDYIGVAIYSLLIIVNSGLGFSQDYYSQMSVDCMDDFCSGTQVKVIRDGVESLVNSEELVRGDLLVLKAGDVVSADGRLVKSVQLSIDEAHLTGESISVLKDDDVIFEEKTPVGDRKNMVMGGSHITQGTGRALICFTGMSTQIGRITKSLNQSQSGTTGVVQRSMRSICIFIVVMTIPIWIIWMYGYLTMPGQIMVNFIVALSIAVSPKFLEPLTTLISYLGVKKMVKVGVIIRRNDALETMGIVTDLCSDKTGTITMAKMAVTKVWVPTSLSIEGEEYDITGNGYSPVGDFVQSNLVIDKSQSAINNISMLVIVSRLCNNASINQDHQSGEWDRVGEPTEAALNAFSYKLPQAGIDFDDFFMVYEFPFDPFLKVMSVVVREISTNKVYIYTKGAPEMVISKCSYVMVNGLPVLNNDFSMKGFAKDSSEIFQRFMNQGLRNLCFAFKEVDEVTLENLKPTDRLNFESDLTFIGLVGINDPPRPGVKDCIQKPHEAHVTVRMITGDHLGTAKSIAKQVGIITASQELLNNKYIIMNGAEFDSMSDIELDALPSLPLVIARCTPHTKVRLVHSIQRRNRTVAMTGDGVNDSPSLKLANVGIAMGMNGSQVTQQAANIVLSDDQFCAILPILAEGRKILTNIVNVCRYLLTINVANLALVLLGLIIKASRGSDAMHVTSYQIIFIHMISIPPVTIALGLQNIGEFTMSRPSRNSNEGIFNMENLLSILFDGLSISVISFFTYWSLLKIFIDGEMVVDFYCGFRDVRVSCDPFFRARTAKFLSFLALCLLHSINCRTNRASSFSKSQLKSLLKFNFSQQPLLYAIFFGFLVYVPFVYIEKLNTTYFTSFPITWEWVTVPINILIFIAVSEAYKFTKSLFFGPSRRE